MVIHSQILIKIRQAVWPSIRITHTDTQTDRHTSLPLYIRYILSLLVSMETELIKTN